ncbi:biotin synthase BioB [Fusobacterium sp.]|uniref:biotin synthase BioB n=1 Tax=Fusobacterium sp. TaxID=68766 RepID=UPI0026296457|nr:biotin synthase BioB [Fusobacterium sp.]
MKDFIKNLKIKILNNGEITYDEAKKLLNISIDDNDLLEELCGSANEIRKKFCGDRFDLCSITNAKSGKCSENCKYCAQSSFFNTGIKAYPLISKEKALEEAKKVEIEGVHRHSLVTSGRGIDKNSKELKELEKIYLHLKENTSLSLCASHGICDEETLKTLYNSGVETYHHNLETSRDFYDKICTTHTYDERINTIKLAKKVGLKVCSGGIWGLGESEEDRIKMAFELKKLEISSVPINVLMAIKGTPLENNKPLEKREILKMIGIYRFILPKSFLRYAGGRIHLEELQEKGIASGVNSALTGNFLTTTGTTIEKDKEMIRKNGYEI